MGRVGPKCDGAREDERGGRSAGQVHEKLREAILSGDLPAGTVLSQVKVAERLGVSRTPLREAIRLLEREGLIEAKVNRRVRVSELSVTDLEQLYAARIGFEALAVRLTVPRLTEGELRELRSNVARSEEVMLDGRDRDELWEPYNRSFHRLLTSHAGRRLVDMAEDLSDHAERYRRAYKDAVPRASSTSLEEHRAILEACEARDDVLAAELLARHYSTVALGVVAVLEPEHDPVAVRTALRMVRGR